MSANESEIYDSLTAQERAAFAVADVVVCLGPPRCSNQDGEGMPCPYCYIIKAGDPRSTEEHMKILNGGH